MSLTCSRKKGAVIDRSTAILRAAFVLLCLLSSHLYADPIDGIILYPVPLDPGKQALTIADEGGRYSGKTLLVKLQIYDINGDLLFDRNYNSLPIYWKGFSTSGKSVTNGVYIIRLTIEELNTGTIEKKLFRILVKK